MQLNCKLELRYGLDGVEIPFRSGVGGKIILRIRLTSAKDLVEVEAELGNYLVALDECPLFDLLYILII